MATITRICGVIIIIIRFTTSVQLILELITADSVGRIGLPKSLMAICDTTSISIITKTLTIMVIDNTINLCFLISIRM
jgi:hypothetical protein